MPQNQDSVVLVLRNNGAGGCGNDLAIDDITFSPLIPFTIGYIATTNYCETGTVILQATVPGRTNTSGYVFQWQQSTDGGSSWQNTGNVISNFSNATITLNANSIGNELFRIISSASAENFNNSNCYVASGTFNGNSVNIPTGTITSANTNVCGTTGGASENVTFTVNYQGIVSMELYL